MVNIKNGDIVVKLVHIQIKVLNFYKFYGKVGVMISWLLLHLTFFVKIFFQAYVKINLDSGVVLDGQLRRIAKRIGTRKIARNLASYAQAKARQKVISLNYYVYWH